MRRRNGLTLLETLLAVTILASISALVATLWHQVSAWSSEAGQSGRALRLTRVLELMRSQWADRRTTVALNDGGSSVETLPELVGFVTTTPVLDPSWPVVRARYIIERDLEPGSSAGSTWSLVYEERRFQNLGSPMESEKPGSTPWVSSGPAELPARRMVLLRGCPALRIERFGRDERVEKLEAELRHSVLDERGEPVDPELRSRLGSVSESERKLPRRWLELEKSFQGRTPAVRIVGEYEGEAFACVLVIGDSR